MQVAQAKQRERREMRSRGLAADCQPPRVVLEHPESGVLAVVGRGREGMLGREAVLDAHRGQPGRLRELREQQVLAVG